MTLEIFEQELHRRIGHEIAGRYKSEQPQRRRCLGGRHVAKNASSFERARLQASACRAIAAQMLDDRKIDQGGRVLRICRARAR